MTHPALSTSDARSVAKVMAAMGSEPQHREWLRAAEEQALWARLLPGVAAKRAALASLSRADEARRGDIEEALWRDLAQADEQALTLALSGPAPAPVTPPSGGLELPDTLSPRQRTGDLLDAPGAPQLAPRPRV